MSEQQASLILGLPDAAETEALGRRIADRLRPGDAVLLEVANRVNTALGVDPMDDDRNRRAAAFLLRRGYDL